MEFPAMNQMISMMMMVERSSKILLLHVSAIELQAEFYLSQAWALGIKFEGSRVCGSTTLSRDGVSAQRRACVSDSMSKSSQLTLQMRCHYRYEGFETKSSLSWVIGNEGIQFKESFEDAIDAQDIDEAKEADVKNEAQEAN